VQTFLSNKVSIIGSMTQLKKQLDHGFLVSLTMPSNPELLKAVRCVVASLAEDVGFSSDDCCAVTRAVDEALANIIRHAYHSRRDQPISLTCRRVRKRSNRVLRTALEITLIDHGSAADPAKLHGRPLDKIEPGGLGLHFIRKSMDVFSYARIGSSNRLRLVRYGPEGAPSREPADAPGNGSILE